MTIHSLGGSSVAEYSLPISEVTGYKLSIVANYADSSKEESDMFCYENGKRVIISIQIEGVRYYLFYLYAGLVSLFS